MQRASSSLFYRLGVVAIGLAPWFLAKFSEDVVGVLFALAFGQACFVMSWLLLRRPKAVLEHRPLSITAKVALAVFISQSLLGLAFARLMYAGIRSDALGFLNFMLFLGAPLIVAVLVVKRIRAWLKSPGLRSREGSG